MCCNHHMWCSTAESYLPPLTSDNCEHPGACVSVSHQARQTIVKLQQNVCVQRPVRRACIKRAFLGNKGIRVPVYTGEGC